MGRVDDPRPPPTLDYRTPRPAGGSLADRVAAWVRYRGPDSFLGALALTLALAAYVFGIGGCLLVGRSSLGAGLIPCGLSVIFMLVALVERGSSKTFPLASLILVAFYVVIIFSILLLLG